MSSPNGGVAWAAIDTLCCLLLVILVLIAPPAKPPSVEAEGVYMLRLTWPAGDDDADVYVQAPGGEILFFANRNVQLMHLDRDDLGVLNDVTGAVEARGNEERVTFRGVIPGEHVVNVHLYRGRATKVRVRLYKLRGPDTLVTEQTVTLGREGAEETAFRVTFTPEGGTERISRLPKSLVGEVYG